MSLTDLWNKTRSQLEGKKVHQIIAFAGEDGRLRDGNIASQEFRDFLSQIPSSLLKQYLEQCLEESFTDSGYVLQDLVNQIGSRLGFLVTDGRYRGVKNQVGFDGVWQFPNSHVLIVEVKTTDTYQIPLDTIAKYRRTLVSQGKCLEEDSSILIVLGKRDKDTNDLEAQIRGSRHAWYTRLISADALARLMTLKEDVDDPEIISQISQILIPREYTKLDGIIELMFSTAEDIKQDESEAESVSNGKMTEDKPVAFHDACIKRIGDRLNMNLLKRSRTGYSSPDDSLRLTCAVSRLYGKGEQKHYWFAFHPAQRSFLEEQANGFAAFGCGSENTVVLIPLKDLTSWLDQLHTTQTGNRVYWHINITEDGGKLALIRKKGSARIDLTKYLI